MRIRNKNLFDNREKYEMRFTRKGFISDAATLINNWRCGKKICDFVSANLGINISSNRDDVDATGIFFPSDPAEIAVILNNTNILKMHFKECYKYGTGRRNWGDTKGEDHHEDICVMLNKKTTALYKKGKLRDLPPSTRNKLYVAITRAHGNVYLVCE